jgi:YYY domain-containing protein
MNVARARGRWLLLTLASFALAVRLFGLNFDQSHFFHPDERRIAEAVTQLSLRPLQLNPHFFAYGSFPLYVTKLVTSLLANVDPWFSSYDAAVKVGRALSAVWGAGTVVLLVFLGRRLFGGAVGWLAGILLSATVLHVQNSHFATNDVPLTFLVLLALSFMVAIADGGRRGAFAGAGLAVGFAAATKFSALPLLLPLLVAAAIRWWRNRRSREAVGGLALAAACMLAAFALAEPYALLDARAYLHDILEQSRMVRHAGLFPYTNQYIGVPKVFYDLREMVIWGMGPFLGLAALIGTFRSARPKVVAARPANLVLLAWAVPFFAVTASFDVKFLRYLLPIYPLLILWGAAWLQGWAERSRAGRWARGSVVAATVLYLLAFLSIYTRPHATVTASRWFYAHVPAGSKVVIEDWDEGFPLPLPGESAARYRIVAFPFYDADTPAKVAHLAAELTSSDYLVLQTKRIYGAVTRAPAKFPLTNNFFRELFAGDLGFTLVRDVASRPSLLGVQLPTALADESFSVYDHPKAVIFRNTGHLGPGLVSDKILHGLPSRPLSRTDLLLARAGTPSPEGARATMWVRSSPVATFLCVLLAELLGLAAFAVLRAFLPPRAGLYALGKVAGVLAFAYISWLAVSTVGVPFGQSLLVVVAVAIIGLGVLVRRRDRSALSSRREILGTEIVVWGTFAFFLIVRALHPAIYWGEKPMDFSFLNTLYRTTVLPPPEPWLAGSPLTYTYFGHFAIAAIGKALAIDPAVMFNIGIALVAALVAAALVGAGAVLGGNWRTGAVAALLTLFVGNLSGVRQLLAIKAVNFDYFWATSRVIPNTINEYPFWSFVFADLHAHVLAMPWAVAFVCVLLLWVARRAEPTARRPRMAVATLLAGCAVTLGAIMVTNGWSAPTYSALVLAVLAADWVVHHNPAGAGRMVRKALTMVVVPATVIVGGAFLAFAPFWRAFTAPARQWGPEVGPFAHPTDFLLIFGVFLVLLVPFLFVLWRRVMSPAGRRLTLGQRVAMAILAAALALSLVDVRALGSLVLRQAPSIRTFALALCIFGLYLALHRQTPERYRMSLVLATFALGLTAACEFVFVWDRMNTLFKFYLDAWLLLGVACSPLLVELMRRSERTRPLTWVWRVASGGTLLVGIFTAVSGAYGAVTHRHANGPRFTLDGRAYLERKSPQEAAAIAWLNRNIAGIPVLAEAYGPSYSDYSRVSMNTGLPIVLGWDYHVYQRGHTWSEINRRKADVRTIYSAHDEAKVSAVLARYHVALIYDGPLERETYPGGNLANFERWTDLLTPVYENGGVTIFAVNGAFKGGVPVTTVERVPETSERPAPGGAPPQSPPGVLRQPRGIACDSGGDAYVADFGNCRVQKFDVQLKFLTMWGRRGSGTGEFADPCAVAVGPAGAVYVADTWNGRVQVFDGEGKPLRTWGGDLFGPRGIAVDRHGRVFVADTGNNRIVRFSQDGVKETQWGTRGAAPGELYDPAGIAVDPEGRVFVCDNSNGRLQIFDANGRFVSAFPVPGWRREVYSEPFVTVDVRGEIWVSVPLEHEVRLYATDGRVLKTIPIREPDGVKPATPMGVALRPSDGALLVTTLDGRLLVPHAGNGGADRRAQPAPDR